MERVRWLPEAPKFVRDVVAFLPTPLGAGVLWVRGRSGGVSTSEVPLFSMGSQRNWVARADQPLDQRLNLREDPVGSGHWIWEPVTDMPYVEYHGALRAANLLFT
jgi:hypothetical protein